MGRSTIDREKSLVDRLRACQRAVPANKTCADCPERGPTYVCLDFQTFICQTCSGIHREFGHKVKSISLSEWAAWEVDRVEAGGNERAAREWLGRRSKEEGPEPDGSDTGLLRDFMRLKYKEERWRVQQPPRGDSGPPSPALHSPLRGPEEDAEAFATPAVAHGDLLSGIPPCASLPAPPLLPGAPKPAAVPVPPVSGAAAVQWTADFSFLDQKEVMAPAVEKGSGVCGGVGFGLIDLDLCVSAEPVALCAIDSKGEEASTDHLEKAVSEKEVAMAAAPGAAAATDAVLGVPQDPDLGAGAKSPVGEPAEEPAPTSEASLADRLREAVLSGSGDEVKRLFRQCSEPQSPPRKPASPERYAAFDEIFGAPSEGKLSPTLPPAKDPVPQAEPTPSPPMLLPSSPTGAGQPSAAGPLTPRQLARLMPKGDNVPTPQQLELMSPRELVQMQAMISQALQARMRPAPLPAPESARALPALAVLPAPDALPGSEPSPRFGDLLTEFTERNPIVGFQVRA